MRLPRTLGRFLRLISSMTRKYLPSRSFSARLAICRNGPASSRQQLDCETVKLRFLSPTVDRREWRDYCNLTKLHSIGND